MPWDRDDGPGPDKTSPPSGVALMGLAADGHGRLRGRPAWSRRLGADAVE